MHHCILACLFSLMTFYFTEYFVLQWSSYYSYEGERMCSNSVWQTFWYSGTDSWYGFSKDIRDGTTALPWITRTRHWCPDGVCIPIIVLSFTGMIEIPILSCVSRWSVIEHFLAELKNIVSLVHLFNDATCNFSTRFILFRHERLRFRLNLYELRENRRIKPKTFVSMVSNLLYERRLVYIASNSHVFNLVVLQLS